MKFLAMIPARYAATRFPGKLMQLLGDKPVIVHTYLNTVASGLFDDVMVVTDSDIIYDTIVACGGKAIMSKRTHESGSDRIAEAIEHLAVDVIVNVQGDEPFVQKQPLEDLLSLFNDSVVQVGSIIQELKDPEFIRDPNRVKVVVDKKMNVMLFTRSVVPYQRDTSIPFSYYQHIGIYAFRKEALMRFTQWEMTPLERIEKLEGLRYLENGVPIRVVIARSMGFGIDTPEDLVRASKLL